MRPSASCARATRWTIKRERERERLALGRPGGSGGARQTVRFRLNSNLLRTAACRIMRNALARLQCVSAAREKQCKCASSASIYLIDDELNGCSSSSIQVRQSGCCVSRRSCSCCGATIFVLMSQVRLLSCKRRRHLRTRERQLIVGDKLCIQSELGLPQARGAHFKLEGAARKRDSLCPPEAPK